MKIKLICSLMLCTTLAFSNASDTLNWKLRLGAGYAPGFLTENTQTSQLHAHVGFERQQIVWRMDGFYFLNAQGDRPRFKYNHQLYLGGYYKFLKGNFNPFIGAQIGLAFAESSEYGIIDPVSNEVNFEPSINPVGSLSTGIEYSASERLFFFLEGKYIFGKHISNSYPTYLDELRFSIGIGFNLLNKPTK